MGARWLSLVTAPYKDKQLCLWKNLEIELTVAEFGLIKCLSKHNGVVKDRNQLMDAKYGESI